MGSDPVDDFEKRFSDPEVQQEAWKLLRRRFGTGEAAPAPEKSADGRQQHQRAPDQDPHPGIDTDSA